MKILLPYQTIPDAARFLIELPKTEEDIEYYFDGASLADWSPFPTILTIAGICHFMQERDFSGPLPLPAFSSGSQSSQKFIPLTEIHVDDWISSAVQEGSYSDRVDIIEDHCLKPACLLGGDNKELCCLLEYLLRESIRNAPEHGDISQVMLCGKYSPEKTGKPVELAILDEGIGILSSLHKNRRYRDAITSHSDALKWAVKPGISASFDPAAGACSRTPNGNSGFGLFMISEICRITGGSMTLLSGDSCLCLQKNQEEIFPTSFQGTALGIQIPTESLPEFHTLLDQARKQGEKTAKNIKNAFKKASRPSIGLLHP